VAVLRGQLVVPLTCALLWDFLNGLRTTNLLQSFPEPALVQIEEMLNHSLVKIKF
jgi:hypothetical protein